MNDSDLYQAAIEGIRRTVLEAIEVLNAGRWGCDGSEERSDAIKCRAILRRIVPHDRATGKDLPVDLFKMQDRSEKP